MIIHIAIHAFRVPIKTTIFPMHLKNNLSSHLGPIFPILKSRKSSPSLGKKKRTPRKSPRKSPNKSPGKMSSQRSLYSTFKSQKGNDTTEALALPSPSQIDPTVFDALPEDVKKDIEISYRQRNLRIGMRPAEKVWTVSKNNCYFFISNLLLD